MKIVICTTPIRPVPTNYPPFGSMALIQSLRQAGYDPFFYDIDGLRPSFDEVVDFFRDQKPDVLGISAVVSTAYGYTKRLVQTVKEVSPNTKIVVGGNLAASAELLLRFCQVDICAIGEGERLIVNLARYWEDYRVKNNLSQLRDIKGLSYLDDDNEIVFTGYDVPIAANEFPIPEWSVLEEYSNIEKYIVDPLSRYDFAQDSRSYNSARQGKKMATIISAKGCVARCTFCHRWDKGYRHFLVDNIMGNINYLIDKYNVGFIQFGDENFGSDRRKLDDLIEQIKPLDILYTVSGVRVRSVDPDLLTRLKESGCVAMYYGMETGSEKILGIMEKNSTVQQNVDAARWTHNAGIYTIYQLVLGMPGETPATISETGEFMKNITEFLPEPPHKRLSINYIQALPGTPVYEYARNTGSIGNSLLDEEKYLLSVSDINAVDDTKFLNFTEHAYFTVQSWRPRLVFDAEVHWHKQHNWKRPPTERKVNLLTSGLPETEAEEDYQQGGYFNLRHSVMRHPLFFRLLSFPLVYPLRIAYPITFVVIKDFIRLPKRRFFSYCWEFCRHKFNKRRGLQESRSLRKIMGDRTSTPENKSEENMLPMREGR